MNVKNVTNVKQLLAAVTAAAKNVRASQSALADALDAAARGGATREQLIAAVVAAGLSESSAKAYASAAARVAAGKANGDPKAANIIDRAYARKAPAKVAKAPAKTAKGAKPAGGGLVAALAAASDAEIVMALVQAKRAKGVAALLAALSK